MIMKISKKCQYGLKAAFELAWRNNIEPISAQDIAKAQNVSTRFMEVILNELKRGGLIESKRGNEGGYVLAKDTNKLTVRDIIECIDGPIEIVNNDNNKDEFSIGNEAFKDLWQKINNAILEVCEKNNFESLIKYEKSKRRNRPLTYNI